VIPTDLYDYLNKFPSRLPTPPASRVSISVSDDWPDAPPITLRELQLTEAYLEKVLAELLGPLP
jgi:hypothetical protein